MASPVATPSRGVAFGGLGRVFSEARGTRSRLGARKARTRGRYLKRERDGTVRPSNTVCRGSRFSEQLGDAGAPKPGSIVQSPPLYVKRTVREGQTVRHPGTIIVLGDVKKGCEVIAGGDVFVWGSLRGDVVAGSKGDLRAKVFSLDLRPSSLVIGGVVRAVPTGTAGAAAAASHASGVPQVAEVSDDDATTTVSSSFGIPSSAKSAAAVSFDGKNKNTMEKRGKMAASKGRRIVVLPANANAARLADESLSREKAIAQSLPARRTAYFTGFYIAAVGVALVTFPSKTFALLFALANITNEWIRVLGVLCLTFGTYYVGSAWGDARGMGARGFYFATVVGRVLIFSSFLFMVGCGYHPEPALLVLGFVNLVGALAMAHALTGGGKGRGEAGGET